jgi:methionyl-tRNA formyltransferase
MMRKKVVFLGSKPIGYECFLYLISRREELNIEISGISTQERKEFGLGHDLAQLAQENNIPVLNSADDIPECDIIYSVQYHKILTATQISKAKQIAVNLHMAPLPEYRGSNQFSYAIIDDMGEFGTTIHQIDTRIDHGDILFEKRFPIPVGCWVNELYQLTYDASIELFHETMKDIVTGNYTPTPQKILEEKRGTSLHFRNEVVKLKLIDLNWERAKIERHIRATSMPGFEPPYTIIDGQKVYFTRNEP